MSEAPQQERRIAACLNACQSVSTEDLERYYETGAGIDEALEEAGLQDHLKAVHQRDQLLAALQKIAAMRSMDADDIAGIALSATEAAQPVGQCPNCLGTKRPHSLDHEWKGRCECAAQPVAVPEWLISADDMKNLRRFAECCEDPESGGHDVPKSAMKRLELAGAVRSCGFGRHETTAFGDAMLAAAPKAGATAGCGVCGDGCKGRPCRVEQDSPQAIAEQNDLKATALKEAEDELCVLGATLTNEGWDTSTIARTLDVVRIALYGGDGNGGGIEAFPAAVQSLHTLREKEAALSAAQKPEGV